MKTYVLDTNIISYYLKGNEEIIDKFSRQRKNSVILIAAYCIQNNYILVSNNVKHFNNIGNLRVENWVN
jgi:predicted nucleic acid-binding protein